jgi:hypothetical protein
MESTLIESIRNQKNKSFYKMHGKEVNKIK